MGRLSNDVLEAATVAATVAAAWTLPSALQHSILCLHGPRRGLPTLRAGCGGMGYGAYPRLETLSRGQDPAQNRREHGGGGGGEDEYSKDTGSSYERGSSVHIIHVHRPAHPAPPANHSAGHATHS